MMQPQEKSCGINLIVNVPRTCDYVVIPHNSNLSNGLMFEDPNAEDYQRIADREPLIEIFQHKGASECIDEDDLIVILNY
jgi:hypothetical protein